MNENFNQISNQEILNGIHELEDYFVKRLQKNVISRIRNELNIK